MRYTSFARHVTMCAAVLAGHAAVAAPPAPAPAPAPAAVKDRISSLLAMPFATDLVGAAQAPRIAWVERRDGVRNVLASEEGQAPRKLTGYTRDDGTDLWGVALTPDGRTVAYVEGGDPEYPDDAPPNAGNAVFPGKQTVHVVLPNGHEVVAGEGHSPVFSPDGSLLAFSRGGTLLVGAPSAPAKPVLHTDGAITEIVWSPDGKRVAVALDRGAHGVIALWRRDAPPAAPLEFVPPGLATDQMPVFSPDGRFLAFVRAQTSPPDSGQGAKTASGQFWSLHVYDLQTGTENRVWTAPAGVGARFAAREGETLLWTADNQILFPWEGSGWSRVCALPATGSTTPRCLTPDGAEIQSYALSQDGKSLLYTSNAGNLDEWRAWSQPLAGGTPTALTSVEAEVTELVKAGPDVAVMATGVRQTAHPVVLTHGKELVPVVLALPAGVEFVVPENVRFRSTDGLDLHGQLFLPPGSAASRHPALVFVHGGPRRQMLPAFNAMGYYSNAYLMNQTLAAEGYVVLSVNYRSGTGYGEAFRNAPGIGRGGATEYRDVLAAATYLRGRSDVDSARLGIWGGSWGGYLTGLALARNSDIFVAGADFHGVHDLTRRDHPGLSPEQNRAAHELEWRSSPAADLAHWRSPVLLVHGDDDRNVDFNQSLLLSGLLTARGVEHEDHVFPGERHAFLRTQDWLTAYLWMDAFLARTVRDKGKNDAP